MKHNMLKLDMNDIVRRKLAAELVRNRNGLPKSLERMLPEYAVVLPEGFSGKNVRFLATLSTRHKGKKRIYSDVTSSASRVHLYYVNKKDLVRVARKNPTALAKVIDMGFANRWCLSVDKPISACNSLCEWLNTLICVESIASRQNHPPSGTTAANSVWRFGPYAESHFAIDPNLKNEIVCRITRRVV